MTATQPAPPAARPGDAPRRRRRRILTLIGVVVAAALVVQGAAQLASWLFARTTSASETLAATAVVELVADGQVEIVAAGVDDVRVDRTSTFAWPGPSYEVTSTGDRTVVRHECPTLPALRCSADLLVEVPEGTHVVVRANDGGVRAAGLLGDVSVNSGDGDVAVTGAEGRVDVRSIDGNVKLGQVGGDATVELSDGHLTVLDMGGDVRVRSVDGSVTVGDVGGDADVRMADGRVEVRDVRGALRVHGVDGDVSVAAVEGDVRVRTVDGDVTVRSTGEPVALSVRTDGRERIEAPTNPGADVKVELVATDGDVSYLNPED